MRRWIMFAMAASAVAGPYVASETGVWETGSNWLASDSAPTAGEESTDYLADATDDVVADGAQPADVAPLAEEHLQGDAAGYFADHTVGADDPEQASRTETLKEVSSFRGKNEIPFLDIFRFDINPEWVQDRWPRIATSTPEANLFGMRTPVVTGTRLQDLAGSITWYFDDRRQVQRLRFEGTCGDASDVVAMTTQSFGMEQESAVGKLVFTKRWHNVPRCVVVVEQPPVIDISQVRQRYIVRMEINRPDTRYDLSDEYKALYASTNAKPQSTRPTFGFSR